VELQQGKRREQSARGEDDRYFVLAEKHEVRNEKNRNNADMATRMVLIR
jgi:hypothetical protein